MTIALPVDGSAGVGAIQPSSLQTVTFSGGEESIIIPNGALAVSDPLNFAVAPQSNVAITMYLASGQDGTAITSHPGSRTTTWLTVGNQVGAANLTGPVLNSTAHWRVVILAFCELFLTWVKGISSLQSKRGPQQTTATLRSSVIALRMEGGATPTRTTGENALFPYPVLSLWLILNMGHKMAGSRPRSASILNVAIRNIFSDQQPRSRRQSYFV